jgi:hypothetical protein
MDELVRPSGRDGGRLDIARPPNVYAASQSLAARLSYNTTPIGCKQQFRYNIQWLK